MKLSPSVIGFKLALRQNLPMCTVCDSDMIAYISQYEIKHTHLIYNLNQTLSLDQRMNVTDTILNNHIYHIARVYLQHKTWWYWIWGILSRYTKIRISNEVALIPVITMYFVILCTNPSLWAPTISYFKVFVLPKNNCFGDTYIMYTSF